MKLFRALQVVLLVAVLCLVTACAFLAKQQTLTPKQQATIWMDIYNFTYDDTMTMTKNPLITPAQKDLVAKKKAVLVQVWPLLKAYVLLVNNGGVPSAQDTANIAELINRLTALATGGK